LNTHEHFVVKHLLSHILPSTPADIDLFALAEKMRVSVLFEPVASHTISHRTRKSIVLDARLSAPAQRVDLAHELCHIAAHAGNQLQLPASMVALQEEQCKRMALYLLCPTSHLERYIDAYLTRSQSEICTAIADCFEVPILFAHERLRVWILDRHLPVSM
jgi:Zn-dependent peptidase ImmA (M78 family)